MSDTWADWAAARPASETLHLDSAAVGRQSLATLEAVAAHARLEAEVGGYVAEEVAAEQLDDTRRDVARVLGTDPGGLAFTESAMVAFDLLVRAWPLGEGARVATAGAAWGPNLEVVRHHGHRTEQLALDGAGVVDLEALERQLRDDPPDVVFVDQVAAHRGLVQPAAEIVALGQANGVAVWLDAAQAVGQVVVPAGADAVVATSRKWLAGPRGVGMLAVAEAHRAGLRVRHTAKHPDWEPVQLLESEEAHVAGRVGLGVAVREHLELGPTRVVERLAQVGSEVRAMVASLPGWEVAHPDSPAGAITGLRPTRGQDPVTVARRLLVEHRIVTTASLPWRAPLEMAECPLLRVSPHVDLQAGDLERLAEALRGVERS